MAMTRRWVKYTSRTQYGRHSRFANRVHLVGTFFARLRIRAWIWPGLLVRVVREMGLCSIFGTSMSLGRSEFAIAKRQGSQPWTRKTHFEQKDTSIRWIVRVSAFHTFVKANFSFRRQLIPFWISSDSSNPDEIYIRLTDENGLDVGQFLCEQNLAVTNICVKCEDASVPA